MSIKPGSQIDSVIRNPQQRQVVQTQKWQSKKYWYLIAGAIAGVAVISMLCWYGTRTGEAIKQDRYQAVFLQDGRVFFGKLQNTHGDYLTLTNPYYSPPSTTSQDATAQLESTKNVSLIKMGEEVYGPENVVSISRDKVLFWQNLQADSKVAQAIKAKQ